MKTKYLAGLGLMLWLCIVAGGAAQAEWLYAVNVPFFGGLDFETGTVRTDPTVLIVTFGPDDQLEHMLTPAGVKLADFQLYPDVDLHVADLFGAPPLLTFDAPFQAATVDAAFDFSSLDKLAWQNIEIGNTLAITPDTAFILKTTAGTFAMNVSLNGMFDTVVTVTKAEPPTTPEPGTLALLGIGLFSIFGITTRKKKMIQHKMMLVLLFVGMTSVTLLIGVSPATAQTINDGLVAYYPFNGNANDDSGNSHYGVVNGATLTTDRFGRPNSAYSFDGGNDYIVVADSDLLDLTTRATFAIWVNVADDINYNVYGAPHLFSKGATYGVLWADYGLFLASNQAVFEIADGSNRPQYNNFSAIPESTWVHLVVVYENATLTVYQNGVRIVGPVAAQPTMRTSNQPLYIGHRFQTVDAGSFKGALDDFRIYNRALSAEEIQQLYNEGGWKPNTLTITKTGTGSGTVISNPAGINCGTGCSGTYAEGTAVILTAMPDANSQFENWTGCDNVNGNTCTVTMSGNKSITAKFGQSGITVVDIPNASEPAWSLDGGRLAFRRNDNIWTIAAHSTDEKQITHMPSGRFAAAAVYQPNSIRIYGIDNSVSGPDFWWIVWTSSDGNAGRNQVKMVPGGELFTGPRFSEDGSQFCYLHIGYNEQRVQYGLRELMIVNADGSNAHSILRDDRIGATYHWLVSWGRGVNRDRLVYPKLVGNVYVLFTIKTDGTGETQLTNADIGECFEPKWSPDGQDIVFTRRDPATGVRQIYVISSQGTNLRQITTTDGDKDSPEISPDGTKLAYVAKKDGIDHIFIIPYGKTLIRSLILTNRQQFVTLYDDSAASQVIGKLNALAVSSDVQGLVVDLNSDPAVAAAYAARGADYEHKDKANAVADAIRQAILAQWAAHPELEYLVLAGDDRVLPFYRTIDGTVQPDPWTLTDDFYADKEPSPCSDCGDCVNPALFIPDLASGRLVESPTQIVGQIDAFLTGNTVNLRQGAATGYDFLQDSAQGECNLLRADHVTSDCALIGSAWPRSEFVQRVLQTYHDVSALNGHANEYGFGTADGGFVSATEIAAAPVDFARTVFYTPGCHSGYNVVNGVDLPEGFAIKKANYIGNTGYGWGGTGIILSEYLMWQLTHQLLTETETTVGKAVRQAKQQYYAAAVCPWAYDEKVTTESTLYGLPMYKVTSPAGSPAPVTPITIITQPHPISNGLLQEARAYSWPLPAPETSPEGTFYALNGRVTSANGKPVLPELVDALTSIAAPVHGIVFAGGAFFVSSSTPPLQQLRTTNDTPTPAGTGFNAVGPYPAQIVRYSVVDLLAGKQQTLVAAAGQYLPTGQQRIFTDMQFEVYAHASSADFTAPTITFVGSTLPGQDGNSTITVAANDPSGIAAVVLAYTDGAEAWRSVALANSGAVWSGSFPAGAQTEFFVQVVDQAGNVAVADNASRYFKPGDGYNGLFTLKKATGNTGTGTVYVGEQVCGPQCMELRVPAAANVALILKAIPAADSRFVRWEKADGTPVSGSYRAQPGDVVSAVFEQKE